VKIYVLQLWDYQYGWVNISAHGKPMAFFQKKDAIPEIAKMRAKSNFIRRYEARPFINERNRR
jgi:hypothetical protein